VITNNATGKGGPRLEGRCGAEKLLLAGWLRCGHRSRKLQVGYGGNTGRYFCPRTTHNTERRISI
jgi:hypothetical protein